MPGKEEEIFNGGFCPLPVTKLNEATLNLVQQRRTIISRPGQGGGGGGWGKFILANETSVEEAGLLSIQIEGKLL